jgi:hypothetical protein
MSPRSQLEREEESLSKQLDAGEISLAEYNNEMRELQREERGAAQETAERAYRETLEDW